MALLSIWCGIKTNLSSFVIKTRRLHARERLFEVLEKVWSMVLNPFSHGNKIEVLIFTCFIIETFEKDLCCIPLINGKGSFQLHEKQTEWLYSGDRNRGRNFNTMSSSSLPSLIVETERQRVRIARKDGKDCFSCDPHTGSLRLFWKSSLMPLCPNDYPMIVLLVKLYRFFQFISGWSVSLKSLKISSNVISNGVLWYAQ